MTKYIPRSAIIEAQSFQPGMEDGWCLEDEASGKAIGWFKTVEQAREKQSIHHIIKPAIQTDQQVPIHYMRGDFGYHLITHADGTRSLIDPSTFSRDYIHFIG